ncbi:hypothetical protein Cs7R123_79490 [Catellatospora sp. TT07R-123]|uniref:hypothetical protein n=1 Tax=Catellatospora sp. TT07R-123 TaxID=2733863 RepID=UPI001B112334|nr:hypothetical protein [Catellatospora sp. TT07R-123]GHJ50607.1 hypothetical protein Cs7R123_79490 [Catellatospora sp. TT07R-123]
MNAIELVPGGASGVVESATLVEWPLAAGSTVTMQADFGWDMAELGNVPVTARDLLRVVTAAYVADRVTRRSGQLLCRDLSIIVHLEDSSKWTQPALDTAVDLLHWLTGDTWRLQVVSAKKLKDRLAAPGTAVEAVSLLSGGLDSLCGALLQLGEPEGVLYLGHRDPSNAVRRAQSAVRQAIQQRRPTAEYQRLALRPLLKIKEATPRTRSLLFMALGVAAATGREAQRVTMPENGFTSINPPLEPSRGGPLTTRSTHPWTFHQFKQLLSELRLAHIAVTNPYGHMTKGELVAAALRPHDPDDATLAAATLSCAKPNAGRLKGGNANLNCGLCVACLVRRGAFVGGGREDQTTYLMDVLPEQSRQRFLDYRRHDIAAWCYAVEAGFDEYRVLASGMWPVGTDFDAVIDICNRGLKELRSVPRP